MKKWRALGTGLTWAFAWSFLGTGFVLLLGGGLRAAVNMIGPYAIMGLIGGGAFSAGRRRFDEMSLPRFAGWGAVGGLLLSVLFGPETLVTASIATLLGAGCAAGSLTLARRADEMSLPRFAAWGAVGGLLLWVLILPEWGFTLQSLLTASVATLLGAGSAAGSLALVRRADEMSLPRFAAWGAVGGLLLSGIMLSIGGTFALYPVLESAKMASGFAFMGAVSAAGSLALARRSEDRELLEAGADVADIGLNKEETHELLGK